MKTLETGLDNKRVAINMIFSVAAFVLNTLISFFITPYITDQFGSEAYGFIKLANDFASYASLITIALNSMSSRFIMLKREQGDKDAATGYYSSLMVANLCLTGLIALLSVLCVVYLEHLISIPAALTGQVKLTFAITFGTFLVSLVTSIYGNCYYLSNRLDVSSIRTAESTILRVGVTIGLFVLFSPRISYVAVGTLVSTVYLGIRNFFHARTLTPDLKVRRGSFSYDKVKELLSSGIWNSLTKLSQIFSSGLDLLVTNVFVNSVMMGYLSVAKTVPTLIASFNATIANVFSPNLMLLYSQGKIDELKKATKSAMKFMCLFVSIPNAILLTMGTEFFRLWVPDQPAVLINILSILTVLNSCVTGPTQPLYQIFTITNKIRQSSIVLIIYGFVSVGVTLLCLNFTDLGVYAVAGVSFVGSMIVALAYHIPFAAKYLGLPAHTFFPEIGISVLSMLILCGVGALVNLCLDLSSSWIVWFAGAGLTGILGLGINVLLILSREERKLLLGKILRKRSQSGGRS